MLPNLIDLAEITGNNPVNQNLPLTPAYPIKLNKIK